ncbi:hypothetical protein HYZ82_01835 [Candidatus Nomurabacteria bacterium]|nr:hypothetical protein [Candidatus Nomurabacteria bacterium]
MHKKEDLDLFIVTKFLTGPVIKLFIVNSIRFRLELASNREGRFPEHELKFILQDSEWILEFKDWETKKYLKRMTRIMQQAEILIYSQ